uniref:HTH CENPB-type domain-containing protein n=1 Tax=Anopheles epiroticus TaxID=199890 RepID=A0A182PX43_9DIPT
MANKTKNYDENAIRACIQLIESSNVRLTEACRRYKVPRTTIQYRLSSRWQMGTTNGPKSFLTFEEEKQITLWIIEMQRRGFPVTRQHLLRKIADYVRLNSKTTPFKDNQPGRKWLEAFLRRNHEITFRKPESVSTANSRVSESDIRGWFDTVFKWLSENNYSDILKDPSRVFIGDETSFYMNPKTKEVLAQKGSRNVYEIEKAPGKQNITVMLSFNACGNIVYPHVIFPGQRLKRDVLQGFPAAWGIGHSERGWMDAINFKDYIEKVFHPFLVNQGTTFPVILFVDGHVSHKSIEVADICKSLGIILIALYHNTIHITQPADVAVFKPLKDAWRVSLEQWRFENASQSFTLNYFGEMLQKALLIGIKSASIKNGFRVCGLHPFTAEAVDYTKCLNKLPLQPSPKHQEIAFQGT